MYHFYGRFSFLIGIFMGILAALYIKTNKLMPYGDNIKGPPTPYEKWFAQEKGMQRTNKSLDSIRYGRVKHTLESEYLYNEIRVNCMILVKEMKNFKSAQDTWARGCNEITLISLTQKNKLLPKKPLPEDSKWMTLCRSFVQLKSEADWFIVVYDPTFVIMENLRYYVAPMNSSHGIYLGHPVNFWSVDYNSGKAGYILSKGAMEQLKEVLLLTCEAESSFLNREDFYLGKLLHSLNIFTQDTRDAEGKTRFHLYSWIHELFPGMNYYKSSVYPNVCCSPYAITFEAISGDKMYTYNYFLYTLQLFHSGLLGSQAMKQVPQDEVWKKFLEEHKIYHNVSSDEYYRIWEDIVQNPMIFGQQFKPDTSE